MKRGLIVLGIVLAAALVSAGTEGTVYGKGVTLDEPVAITALLEQPGPWIGKAVRVDGVVTAVCAKRGCWIQVTDPDSGKGVRIKVEDGVIVFPPEAVGHRVSAEGIFEAVAVPPAPAPAEPAAHGAAGHGAEPCEKESAAKAPVSATCDAPKTEAEVVYLVRGTGAVVY